MLQIINEHSEYGALPRLDKRGLRDCQYHAETEFEKALKAGEKKSLPVPLAPINVQKRVISRIEEMFALLEE